MPFSETMAQLPFTGRTPQGSGFLPPILRAMGHVLFLNACIADEAVPVSDTEAVDELEAAFNHWTERATSENLSTATVARATLIGTAIAEASAEFTGWDEQTRANNLRDLAHRIVQFGADLDRELVGLTNSDPGTSL
jgi:hypothetical protein